MATRGVLRASLKLYCFCWWRSRSKHVQKELFRNSYSALSLPSAFPSQLNLFWHKYFVIHLELSKAHHVSENPSILNIISYCLFQGVFFSFHVVLLKHLLFLFFWTKVSGFLVLLDIFTGKRFLLSNRNQKTYPMESGKKKSGIHSFRCRAHTSHPAAMILSPFCALGHSQESSVSGVFCLFSNPSMNSLTAERPSAAITVLHKQEKCQTINWGSSAQKA